MKLLMFALLACAFVFSALCPAWSGNADIDLKVEGRTLSANVKEVPLKTILEKLKKETGIWIKGSESLLQGNISAQFNNLPLQDALNRILSSMNYSLVFGPNDKLEGVVIIGKGKSRPTTAGGTAVSNQRRISSSPKSTSSSKATSRGYKKSVLTKSSSTSRNSPKATTEEQKMFQVQKSDTPPGGPVTVTSEELEKFKVKKNIPPPGGPVTVTPEESEKFKVIKNCGPPGGPVTVTPEELEKFKGIKKVPPPGS
jgi:hypothetical protein